MISKNDIRERIYSMDSEDFKTMIVHCLDTVGVKYTLGVSGLPTDGLELCDDDFPLDLKYISSIQISLEKTVLEYNAQATITMFSLSDMESCFDNDTSHTQIATFVAA